MQELSKLLDIGKSYVDSLYYPATEWYFAVSSLIIAAVAYVFVHRRDRPARPSATTATRWRGPVEFFRFCFPKEIYTNVSTKTDLLYLLSFPLIAGLLFKPALVFGLTGVAYSATQSISIALLGEPQGSVALSPLATTGMIAAFTLVSAMAADFGFFLHHYLMHKIGFLWEFHKVHHSAEVLTPMTDYRAHPLEILTYAHAKGLGMGAAQGLFNYFTGNTLGVSTVLGLNAVFFFYYLMAYPLRHSHIWISYGPIASRFFISPAQHQIHHSFAEKHWDKNFGGAFALWDWLFGTLYIPRQRENLEFGLPGGESSRYRKVSQLYTLPFRTAARSRWRMLLVAALVIWFGVSSVLALSQRGLAIL